MFSWVNPDISSAQQCRWFPSASSSCLASKPRRLLLAGRGSWPVCFGGGERLKVTLATRAGGFRGIGRGDVQRLKLVFKSKGSSSALRDGGQCFHDCQTGSVKNKKRGSEMINKGKSRKLTMYLGLWGCKFPNGVRRWCEESTVNASAC